MVARRVGGNRGACNSEHSTKLETDWRWALAALLVASCWPAGGRAGRWSARRDRKYLAPALILAVNHDPETVARGRHLARRWAAARSATGPTWAGGCWRTAP